MERMFGNVCLALTLAVALSCGKEVTRPSEQIQTPVKFECSHETLEHHGAVAATYDNRGNVEYWSCTQCGKRFSDAAAQNEYKGRIYLLPKKFVDASCLSGYDPFPKSGTKDGITAATVATIADLLVTIAGLATSCVSYCDDCEDVISEINEVSKKEGKNASDLEKLNQLVGQISKDLKSYNEKMGEMTVKVDEMIQNINEANAILQNTRETLVKSLEEVSSVQQNIRLYNLFDTRYQDIVNLDSSTSCAWEAIFNLLSSGTGQLAAAKTARDSADVLISKTHQIENVVSAWATDWSYPNKTSALISRYLQMDADYGSSFTKLLDDYSTDHFIWEHQAVEFKKLILDYDFTILAQAFSLMNIYYTMVPDADKTFYHNRYNALKKDFDAMTELAVAKNNEYESSYNDDNRVCRATGKVFAIDAIEVHPRDYFYSVAGAAMTIVDYLKYFFWKLYGLADTEEGTRESAIDDYDLELFCAASASSSLWNICFEDMGFRKDFESDMPAAIMVPFGENEYRVENDIQRIHASKIQANGRYFVVWSNCRVDGMVPKEIDLGEYYGSESTRSVVVDPESYRYFTFKVVGNEEAQQ